MSWNQPGNGGKDPWGGGQNDGPPDMMEALNKLKEKFGGGKGGGNNGGGKQAPGIPVPLIAVLILAVAMLFSAMRGDPHWAFGIYKVDAKERAVVLRFGEFLGINESGLNWNLPYLDSVYIVEVTNVQEHSARGSMLTQDENIVDVPVNVQFDIKDPKAFVLNVKDPVESLKHATDSAVRHVVGSSKLDSVLGEGREVMAAEVEKRLQNYLDIYDAGINIVKVNVLKVEPPTQVKAAFDDVIAAKEDKDRFKEQAEAYKNEIVPIARGLAKRMEQDAIAYKERVIASATGEATRFEQLLTEYKKAPQVTRERLYIDAMQHVMSNTSKVMVDTKEGSGNMLYLPLDKIIGSSSSNNAGASTTSTTANDGNNRQLVDQVTEEVIDRIMKMQQSQSRGASR